MENSERFSPSVESEVTRISNNDEFSSGVSWGAVFGGAFVSAAISLIMLALGAGFGLAVISPWSDIGASAAPVGSAAIVWLIVIEIVSCALGGYLAGRLRTKWATIHTDEVYFRDTANGFLVWAVGLVITVTFLVSSASSMVGSSAPRQDSASGGVLRTKSSFLDPTGYFIDRLFRTDTPGSQSSDALQVEAGRIFVNLLTQKVAPAGDEAYLTKLVTTKTGLNEAEAQRRVSQVVTDARQSEDSARRTASHLLLWIFLAFLMGAFSASYVATIGGRQRDHVRAI